MDGQKISNLENLKKELTGHIHTKWAGQPIYVYESIDSTNAEAARLSAEGAEHGAVIVADTQTAGRGRRGRRWESPAGDNLYCSLLLRPKERTIVPNQAPMLTLVMAVAVAKALQRMMPEQISGTTPVIKWPNDIVLDNKKVCGILTEMRLKGTEIDHVIIGTGINVREREFPQELCAKATSLEAVLGQKISRGELLGEILEEFEALYSEFVQAGDLSRLLTIYNDLLINKDREVTVLDPLGEYFGIARGITGTGELVVELPDGSHREVFAGEVSVRGIYGYV